MTQVHKPFYEWVIINVYSSACLKKNEKYG